MGWLRLLSDIGQERQKQQEAEECAERYKQFSDDDLQKKREQIETDLDSLKRDFPDWEIQMESRAYSAIRRLEKEHECVILERARRNSTSSRSVESQAKSKSTNAAAGPPQEDEKVKQFNAEAEKRTNRGGRPRKDDDAKRAQQLKDSGKTWPEVMKIMNKETGKTNSSEAWRQLVKSRRPPKPRTKPV